MAREAGKLVRRWIYTGKSIDLPTVPRHTDGNAVAPAYFLLRF